MSTLNLIRQLEILEEAGELESFISIHRNKEGQVILNANITSKPEGAELLIRGIVQYFKTEFGTEVKFATEEYLQKRKS